MIVSKKYLIILTSLIFLLQGCSSVKEGLSLKKKANTDEFLVQKKEPLTMPPDFNELPKPNESVEMDDDEIDLTKIFDEESQSNNEIKKNSVKESSLEKSIIKIINAN